jgi:NADH-quinone oxidoreductase subunit A
MLESYIPIVLTFALAAGLAGALLTGATLLGPKKQSQEKLAPFECGAAQVSSPRLRFSVGFYVVAILFIVFDIEVAFVYPWVVKFRELSCLAPIGPGQMCPPGQSSAAGLYIMGTFLGVLSLGLLYVWRKRVLEWE